MISFKNVLLIGASGNLGAPVLKAFLASRYEVSVLTRKESTSTFPEGVPIFKADYTDISSVKAAMEGQDVVISMVGGAAAGDQQVFIDAALAAGVKRFFPSEFGPNSRDPKFAALNHAVLPAKASTVDYLRSRESEMSWSSLVTGRFFEWAMKVGFFGFDLAFKTATLIDGGTSVFTATTLPTIGKALIAILEHADDTKNQYVFVSSFNVSQKDILDTLEKVDQKWTVKHITSEEVIANGERRLAAGDFAGVMDLTRGGAFGKQGLGDSRPYGLWNDKLELPKEDFEQAVRDVL